jgi:peptidoglycan/LPS O-acetylase OafA/YrhL
METIVRKRLHEVDIMRLVVIVLLIADHAFVQYWGGWKMVFEDVDIPAYTWFGKAVYAIMLETFVFISGYLFGNQVDKTGGG